MGLSEFSGRKAGSSLVRLRFLECINRAIVSFVSISFSLRFCREIRQGLFFKCTKMSR